MARSFLAIPCPEEVRCELSGLQGILAGLGDMKTVRPENIHITLKFLGDIDCDQREKIKCILDNLPGKKAFKASVEGVGVFPDPGRPRVLWAGIREGEKDIMDLHEKIDYALLDLGFEKDARFSPHITLARIRSADKKRLYGFLTENKEKKFGDFTVEKIDLMESTLTAQGPVYSRVYSFRF